MKLIYVAGAYRAPTIFEVDANIRRARDRAADVVRSGNYPVVPHLCTCYMDGLAPDALFLSGGLRLLARCDEVWLVQGWERSEGTRQEIAAALRSGIPVLDEFDYPVTEMREEAA